MRTNYLCDLANIVHICGVGLFEGGGGGGGWAQLPIELVNLL